MNDQVKNRVVYLDFLRILSAFFVVSIQVSSFQWYGIPIHQFQWTVMNYVDSFSRVGVPLFIIVSGSLFLSRKNFSVKRFYLVNCSRLLATFIFWTLFYGFDNFGFQLFENVPAEPSPWSWFSWGKYHLWFLPVMLGVYLIVPLLRKVVSHKLIYSGLLLLGFIWSGVKSVWILLPYFMGNEYVLKTPMWVTFLEFVFYFLLGHYLKTTKSKIKPWLFVFIILRKNYLKPKECTLLFFIKEIIWKNYPLILLASI